MNQIAKLTLEATLSNKKEVFEILQADKQGFEIQKNRILSLPIVKLLGYNIFCGKKEFFSGRFKGVVSTINPHSYVLSMKDIAFQEALMESDILIPDGVGIVLAARLLSGKHIAKIAGSDLHEAIIKELDKRSGSCFYLGSTDAALLKIRHRLSHEYHSIRVGSYSPPYKSYFSEEETLLMIRILNDFNPDVLFVGMTAPKQEKWVLKNKHLIKAPIICSIGAVFDFFAGTVKRSGKFWILIGLEWLPRLIRQPQRLWRRTFISTPLFIFYVLREKISMNNLR